MPTAALRTGAARSRFGVSWLVAIYLIAGGILLGINLHIH